MKGDMDALAKLFSAIIGEWRNRGTYSSPEECFEAVEPNPARCGFLRIQAVVQCECGAVTEIQASPAEQDHEALKREAEHTEGMEVVDCKVGDPPEGSPVDLATNIGHIAQTCGNCGRRILAAWEVFSATTNAGIVFPWEDSEIPGPLASGPFGSARPKGTTVH
jgi:hypothetical protein